MTNTKIKILLILFALGCFIKVSGLIINITPSMKTGIYIRAPVSIGRGDTIVFCLHSPYKEIGIENLYILRGNKCQDSDPLIKQVIAVPGDDIFLDDKFIRVNNIEYAYGSLNRDAKGNHLDLYPRGQYSKTKGYWVIGTNSPNSWDSRYWGPIASNQILYKAWTILKW